MSVYIGFYFNNINNINPTSCDSDIVVMKCTPEPYSNLVAPGCKAECLCLETFGATFRQEFGVEDKGPLGFVVRVSSFAVSCFRS